MSITRPRIWIPEKIESTNPVTEVPISFNIGFEGYFHVVLRNTKTNEIKYSGSFKNVLTDRFMNLLGAGSGSVTSLFSALAVGSGSTTPSGTDLTLAGEFGVRTTNNGSVGDGYGFSSGSLPSGSFWTLRRTRYFSDTQSPGTISEFGWWTSTSGGSLVCRSLIRDPVTGAPTSIVKTSDDELLVTYDFRAIVPTTTSSISTTFGPTTHSVTALPIRVDGAFGAGSDFGIGWVSFLERFGSNWGIFCKTHSSVNTGSANPLGGPSFATWPVPQSGYPTFGGSEGFPDVATLATYTGSTYYRDVSYIIRASNSAVNAGGSINGMTFAPYNGGNVSQAPPWLIHFSPSVPKPDTHQIKFTIRYAWYRSGSL